MPSVDVAAIVPEVLEMAQKTVPFHAIDIQREVAGAVRDVQVTPSGEVKKVFVEPPVVPAKRPKVLLHAIEFRPAAKFVDF